MPINPTAGPVAVFKVGSDTVPGSDWKLSIDAKLHDCANFADGRRQKGTLPDADFTSKVYFDADNMPHDPAGFGFTPGAEITALLYVSASKFFSVPIVVGKMSFESKIEDVLMFDLEGKQNGPIVWPVVS